MERSTQLSIGQKLELGAKDIQEKLNLYFAWGRGKRALEQGEENRAAFVARGKVGISKEEQEKVII